MQKLKMCVFQANLCCSFFAKYYEKNTKKSSYFLRTFIVLFFSAFFCGFLMQKLSETRQKCFDTKKERVQPLSFENVKTYSLKLTPSALRISLKCSENALSNDFSSSSILAWCCAMRFWYFPLASSSAIFVLRSAISSCITLTTGEPLSITGLFKSLKVSTVALLGILEGMPVIFGLKVSSCKISTHRERQP